MDFWCSLSPFSAIEPVERRRLRGRERDAWSFERGSPTNYLLRYDLPRLCSRLPRRTGFERPFKLSREIKLLRVSSRYYTHVPLAESRAPPSRSIILAECRVSVILRNRCGFARLMRLAYVNRLFIRFARGFVHWKGKVCVPLCFGTMIR